MKKTILFDMDGVIIDSEPYFVKRYQKALEALNIEYDIEKLKTIIGTSQKQTIEIIQSFSKTPLPKDFEHFTNQLTPIENEDFNQLKMSSLNDLLDYLLKHDYKIAICSSSPLDFIHKITKDLSIGHYFNFVLSGDQFIESKPHPEIYLKAAQKMNSNNHDCIVIEDSIPGIKAAKNAGMTCIAVKNKFYEIDYSQADWVVDQLAEIPIILNKIN